MSQLLKCIEIETAPNPTASIIILHGLGASGDDFVPIASEMDLRAVGPVRFVFPYAPQIPVTINGGYVMPAWYDIRGTDLATREDEAGLRQSQAAVQALIEREMARGVASNRIVLAGFSQGCAMTLMTGLRFDKPLAGLACLSGYLPLAATTAAERHSANQSTSIFMAHGQQDGVVPIDRARISRDLLAGLGYGVEWHDYPMAHSVSPQEVAHWNAWLLGVLSPNAIK